MDWKYAHYHQEIVLPSTPGLVREGARVAAAELLAGWRITSTANGFEAKGSCGWHAATATFQIEPLPSGTRVAVTLLVERAGVMGYVGWDAFGFYDGQIRHWLEGMRWHAEHPAGSPAPPEAIMERQQTLAKHNRRMNTLLVDCPAAFLLFLFFSYGVCAVAGLLSGTLLLPSRGSGGLTIHGVWARILSGAILVFQAWLVLRLRGWRRSRS